MNEDWVDKLNHFEVMAFCLSISYHSLIIINVVGGGSKKEALFILSFYVL